MLSTAMNKLPRLRISAVVHATVTWCQIHRTACDASKNYRVGLVRHGKVAGRRVRPLTGGSEGEKGKRGSVSRSAAAAADGLLGLHHLVRRRPILRRSVPFHLSVGLKMLRP